MPATKNIHTLNARGNIMLEVERDYFNFSSECMFQKIQALRRSAEEALALKGIKYDDLKTALVPDRKRKEIALVFDTIAIDDSWYGMVIFRKLIPLFDEDSNHSILAGDYIDDIGAGEEMCFEAISETLKLKCCFDYNHNCQLFIVYINNLTDRMIERFHNGLLDWRGYVGYADTTYASRFKVLLSKILVNAFIKNRKNIIQGHEDDRPNSEDVNMSGYPFEENGYTCRSVQFLLMSTLLSYKIERPVVSGFEADTEFALNSISPNPEPLQGFAIEVQEAKLDYIKNSKAGSIAKAGLKEITANQLSALIHSKISSSYIYNMSFDQTHNVAKFNLILELLCPSDQGYIRLLAAMEYKPKSKTLRLITLY